MIGVVRLVLVYKRNNYQKHYKSINCFKSEILFTVFLSSISTPLPLMSMVKPQLWMNSSSCFPCLHPGYQGLPEKHCNSTMDAIPTLCHQALVPQNCPATLLCFWAILSPTHHSKYYIHSPFLQKISLQMIQFSGIILISIF